MLMRMPHRSTGCGRVSFDRKQLSHCALLLGFVNGAFLAISYDEQELVVSPSGQIIIDVSSYTDRFMTVL